MRKQLTLWDAKKKEFTKIKLGSVSSERFGEVLSSIAKDYGDYLKKNGWIDMAYWELLNEPTVLEYPVVRRLHSLVHKGSPQLKTILKGPPPYPDLHNFVDIWCPLLGRFDKDECGQRRKKGEEIFWHICNTPYPPYPNFHIDQDGIEPRILFWMAWKEGVSWLLH